MNQIIIGLPRKLDKLRVLPDRVSTLKSGAATSTATELFPTPPINMVG